MNRRMEFEKIQNARDLGGLHTRDGHTICTGMLLRSAQLSEATEADQKKLQDEYRLSKIVDLRTSMEKKEKPDVEIETVKYMPNPIFDERMIGISHEKGTDEKAKMKQMPTMETIYRMLVTNDVCRKNLGNAVRTIMENDFNKGSVLWHCTEGKDRCGLVSAMLLSALSVDRQQIMEDYLLTNEVNEAKADMYYQGILASGRSEEEAKMLKSMFLARESYLEAAYAAIEEKYQDVDTYLREGLEIPEMTILEFRKKVLY